MSAAILAADLVPDAVRRKSAKYHRQPGRVVKKAQQQEAADANRPEFQID